MVLLAALAGAIGGYFSTQKLYRAIVPVEINSVPNSATQAYF
jgi:hypothetical protein